MNKSDSERLAFYLENLGLVEATESSRADLFVLNTCGVRQKAEDRIYGLIPKVKKKNKKVKVVLTGCLSSRKDIRERLEDKVDIWLSIADLPQLDKKLEEFFPQIRADKGDREAREKDYLKITPKFRSDFSAFVPIGNGCNNFCSYCVVPFARGREIYRPAHDIFKEVEILVQKGFKEIVLIAQNVNSYLSPGSSDNIDFPGLLEGLNSISGDFWIRFSTSHPKDMSQELIDVIARGEKICKHIHLPAQAGDDQVLARMNRKYSIQEYQDLVRSIRAKIPEMSLTTDIIVGFPGETKKQFENSVNLFKELRFDMAYISQFSPRPGTRAFDMKDDVAPKEKKRREDRLAKILAETSLNNNRKYLNKKFKVLVEGRAKSGDYFARTGSNKNVKIIDEGNFSGDLIGSFQLVEIVDIQNFGLKGKIKNPEQKI